MDILTYLDGHHHGETVVKHQVRDNRDVIRNRLNDTGQYNMDFHYSKRMAICLI